MKNTNSEPIRQRQTIPSTGKPWRLFLSVGVVTALIVASLSYSRYTGAQIVEVHDPLTHAVMELKLEAGGAHLWFEEILSGDRNQDISEVWRRLDLAEWNAQAMLEGGQSDKGTIVPLENPALRHSIAEVLAKLRDFRSVAMQRYAATSGAGSGSAIDQKFDSIFADFLAQADVVEGHLRDQMGQELSRFKVIHVLLIIACLGLAVLVGTLLHRYRQSKLADLAEVMNSEAALRESEARFRLLVDNIGVGIAVTDLTGKILLANPKLGEIIGHSPQELLNRNVASFYRQGEGELLPFKAAGQDVIDTDFEAELVDSPGASSWINISTRKMDIGGEVVTLVTGIDITDQKQAEAARRQSEHLLVESQKIARLGSYVLDVTAGTWTSSEILDDLFGMDKDFVRDLNGWSQIVHPDHREMMLDYFTVEVIGARKPFDKEYRIVRVADGEERWVSGLGRLEFDAGGQPLRMIGTIRDITERKTAELALMESESLLRTYVSQAPDAIFVTDAEGRFVEVNEAAVRLTRYSEAELLGMSIPDLHEPSEQVDVMARLGSLKKTSHRTEEIRLRRKDGSGVWVALKAVSLSADRYMAFCADISERKRLEELESRSQRLEMAGTVAGQVAHDFNNLMGPMIAYPSLIREELPEDHPVLPFLASIEESAKQVAEINQQLLTLGRRGHYRQDPLDLNGILSRAVAELGLLPGTITTQLDLGEGLLSVTGGTAQVHRIIANLLRNACDAVSDFGQVFAKTENCYIDETSVAYGRVPKGEYVKVTVGDNGSGIPDDIIQNIFDPFFTTKHPDQKRGSGLGLSVVDAVMKDHHGYVDLSTQEGQGTEFYLYFPVVRDETDPGQSDQELMGQALKVLVIDDDAIQRRVCQKLLEGLGHTVRVAESGEVALEILPTAPHDLLILDMIIPEGMDGAETYRKVLEICPDQRAILVSGGLESEQVVEAQRLGAGAFLKKPLTAHRLAEAIESELARSTTLVR